MLTRDVAFDGFTHEQWVLLARAIRPPWVAPPTRAEPASDRPTGGLVAITTGSVLRKLVSTRTGRVEVREQPWPEALEALAARHAARWVAEISAGALEEVADRFGERLSLGQDMTTQVLELFGILRELEAEGALSVWPARLADWPIPREPALARSLDLICPGDRAMVFGVFDKEKLATCLVARRRGSGFDRIVGPDELGRELGLLSGDFRRDHRHLAAAVERRVARVAVGCYGELATFQRLSEDDTPGAWAAAVAARDVVVSPVSPGVAVSLGIDAGRVAFRELRSLAASFGASDWLSRQGPLAQALLGIERPSWLDKDLREFLGFDPWQLVTKLLAKDPYR